MVRLRKAKGAKDILTFAVTLEFENPVQLRKFLADRLFQARASKISGTS